MDLKWYKSQSTVEPVAIDEEASKEVTIVRRNIHTEEVTNEMDNTVTTMYVYEEAMPSKVEYMLWLVAQENAAAHTDLELAVAEAVEALSE